MKRKLRDFQRAAVVSREKTSKRLLMRLVKWTSTLFVVTRLGMMMTHWMTTIQVSLFSSKARKSPRNPPPPRPPLCLPQAAAGPMSSSCPYEEASSSGGEPSINKPQIQAPARQESEEEEESESVPPEPRIQPKGKSSSMVSAPPPPPSFALVLLTTPLHVLSPRGRCLYPIPA
jgi:hypothetical protein